MSAGNPAGPLAEANFDDVLGARRGAFAVGEEAAMREVTVVFVDASMVCCQLCSWRVTVSSGDRLQGIRVDCRQVH